MQRALVTSRWQYHNMRERLEDLKKKIQGESRCNLEQKINAKCFIKKNIDC